MVSFWPFGGDDNSAASFEKALSQLSEKINNTTARNDLFKHRQRKYKALWTIYTVFGYILIDIILVLVTGWEQWGWFEWILVPGGPLGIYIVRRGIHWYYGSRLDASQDHLADLIKQREATVQKLKASTKYDSTQKLLEKYGGAPKAKRVEEIPQQQRPRQKDDQGNTIRNVSAPVQPGRTGMAPPPTANIQLPPTFRPEQNPGSRPGSQAGPPGPGFASPARVDSNAPGEEFAPNAFSSPVRPPMISQPSQQYASNAPKWYDRIMDVILGEDETQAKNRLALICQSCRLVNGQAPPGARTPEDVGRWRCSSCHAWNGVESEEKKILQHAARRELAPQRSTDTLSDSIVVPKQRGEKASHPVDSDDEDAGSDAQDDAELVEPVDVPPADSTRSKARQRRKA